MQLFTTWQGWLLLALFGSFSYLLPRLSRMGRGKATKLSFFVADRGIGWRPAAFSIAATWIWAPALFVAAEQGYQHGWIGVFWFTVPNVLGLMFFSIFAVRMRRRYPDGFTLSGAVRDGISPPVQKVYLVALIGLAVFSFAVQLLAGGLVVSTLTGIPYWMVTITLALIALSYSLRSGLNASIITDYVQMVLIALVGIILTWAVLLQAGWVTVSSGLGGVTGEFTNLVSGPGAGVFWAFGLSTSIGLISAPFGDQSIWQRVWAIREGELRKAFNMGAIIFAVVPLTMGLLGMAAGGAGLLIDDPQLTNLEALLHWLPGWVAVPFLIFILSGLVSTLDSNLSAISSMAGHDMTSDISRVLWNGRAAMIILAVAGIGIALLPGITITGLFIFYGTLRATTLLPTLAMLLFKRKPSSLGTFVGMVGALAIGGPLSAYGNLAGVTPAIVGGSLSVLALSGAGVGIGTWLEARADARDVRSVDAAEYLDRLHVGEHGPEL